MKNAPFLIPFLIFLHLSAVQAQTERYHSGDSIFVWASSLNMRETPDSKSPVKKKIPYGSVVLIMGDSIGKVAYKHLAIPSRVMSDGNKSRPFYLSGFWVKVSCEGVIGYVFDGYLSKIPTFSKYNGKMEDLKNWAKKDLELTAYPYKKGDNAWITYSSKTSTFEVKIGHNEKSAFREISLLDISIQEALMLGIQIFEADYLVVIDKGRYEFKSLIAEGDCDIFISNVKGKIRILLSCHC